MTFPAVPTVAGGRVLSVLATNPAGTHTSPNLSSLTKNAGDLLIAIVGIYDGNSTDAEFSAWGGGFTEFKDQAGTATMGIGLAYKWSDGTETGTFTVTSADTSANDSFFILLSISGAHASTAPEAGNMAVGTAPDSASLSPSWGAADTLWVSVGASGETSTTGSYTGIGTAPTNYGDQSDTGISADAAGGVEGSVAFRQLNAASEDPGTWSMDTSNARGACILFAVRPAPTVTPVSADIGISFTLANPKVVQKPVAITSTLAVVQTKVVNLLTAISTTFTVAFTSLKSYAFNFDIPVTLTVAAAKGVFKPIDIPVTFTLTQSKVVNKGAEIAFAFTVTVVRVVQLLAAIAVTITVTSLRLILLLAALAVTFAVSAVRLIRWAYDIAVSLAVAAANVFVPAGAGTLYPLEVDAISVPFDVQIALAVSYSMTSETDWNKITRELPQSGSIPKV